MVKNEKLFYLFIYLLWKQIYFSRKKSRQQKNTEKFEPSKNHFEEISNKEASVGHEESQCYITKKSEQEDPLLFLHTEGFMNANLDLDN